MNLAPVGKTPKEYAVLPFYGAGAIFFLILSILMFFAAERFQQHFFQSQTLALVHAAALGWGTMIIFGAAYQLIPVIFEKNLFSSKLAFISFLFLTSGSLLLIYSFWFIKFNNILICGGALILIATILYCINVILTANLEKGLFAHKLFVLSSAFWLFLTVLVGLLLAINLVYPFFSRNHFEILKIHAHLGLAGWFLQLICGVSVRLVPMFLLGSSKKEGWLQTAFILQNLGLTAFIIDQYVWGTSSRVYVYFVVVLIGSLFWLAYLQDVYKKRIKRKLEIQMKQSFLSFVFFGLGLLLIPIMISSTKTNWSILYGIFLFLGWISSLILGKTFKTLPFIIWNRHYKTLHGKMKLPLPKDLYNSLWLRYQFWCFVFAMLLVSVGVIFNWLPIIKGGLALWIIVAIFYVLNIIKIFFHKTIKTDAN